MIASVKLLSQDLEYNDSDILLLVCIEQVVEIERTTASLFL